MFTGSATFPAQFPLYLYEIRENGPIITIVNKAQSRNPTDDFLNTPGNISVRKQTVRSSFIKKCYSSSCLDIFSRLCLQKDNVTIASASTQFGSFYLS